MSFELPSTSQLLTPETTSEVMFKLLLVPVTTISVLDPVDVAAEPCVYRRTFESPVAAKSKSVFCTSPEAPNASVWVFESPVLLRVKLVELACAAVALCEIYRVVGALR